MQSIEHFVGVYHSLIKELTKKGGQFPIRAFVEQIQDDAVYKFCKKAKPCLCVGTSNIKLG